MTAAASADPNLTMGELVDKTTKKLEHMSAYMEGAARMVNFEGALSSRAGAEHSRVLEHAQELLQKSEVFLQERAEEAGAAVSGAPSSGSAAPADDARKAEGKDDPMEGPPKKEESSSEELVPHDPNRPHKSATKVPRQFRAAGHTAPPPATMAAYTDEAPIVPPAGADGMHECPECKKGLDSGVRWLLHRAANHGVALPAAVFPQPTSTDQFRQDFRGQWFRVNREGVFVEMTEAHVARSVRKLGPGVVIPLLVKGDRIRLKDQTRLRYGEGFDEESEEVEVPSPAQEEIPSYGGGVRGPAGIEMRDDPDEQEQIRRLRERGSHQSAPVTPPKAAPRQKAGRNKASRTVVLEPDHTPPRPPSGPRAEARAAGVEYDAGAAPSGPSGATHPLR